jgi:hypothetical protein
MPVTTQTNPMISRIFTKTLFFCAFCFVLGNAHAQILVQSIYIIPWNGTDIDTQVGTRLLSASVSPSNADDPSVTWSITNNPGSAIIDQNGLVTAGTNGVATATATANDGSGVYDDFVINITNQPATIDVTGMTIEIAEGTDTVGLGLTLNMSALIEPINATDHSVSWTVINATGSGTIDQSGLFTATAVGSVVISATSISHPGVSEQVYITILEGVGIDEYDEGGVIVSMTEGKELLISGLPNGLKTLLEFVRMDGSTFLSTQCSNSTMRFDTKAWPKGVYVLYVQSQMGIARRKFMVN